MSLTELARVVLRWAWVIIPGILLAAGAAVFMFERTPPSYTQSESYLLLSPVVTEAGNGNPFLQLGNGVPMAASVLIAKVSGGEIASQMAAAEPGVQYTVAPDPSTQAPIVVVTAEGASRAAVAGTLDRVGHELVSQLATLQKDSGAPEVSWVTISQLTSDPHAQAKHSTGLRYGAAAGGAVLLLPLLVVTLLERRRRNRLATSAAVAAAVHEPAAPRRPADDLEMSATEPLPVGATRPRTSAPAVY